MKFKYIYLLIATTILLTTTSCTKEELAFDVIESPVSIEFIDPDSSAEMFTITATVYELDKSGILDNNIGIISSPVSGLTLDVYVNEDTLFEQITTNGDGSATITKDWSTLDDISQLEWTGVHNGISFRIYKKI